MSTPAPQIDDSRQPPSEHPSVCDQTHGQDEDIIDCTLASLTIDPSLAPSTEDTCPMNGPMTLDDMRCMESCELAISSPPDNDNYCKRLLGRSWAQGPPFTTHRRDPTYEQGGGAEAEECALVIDPGCPPEEAVDPPPSPSSDTTGSLLVTPYRMFAFEVASSTQAALAVTAYNQVSDTTEGVEMFEFLGEASMRKGTRFVRALDDLCLVNKKLKDLAFERETRMWSAHTHAMYEIRGVTAMGDAYIQDVTTKPSAVDVDALVEVGASKPWEGADTASGFVSNTWDWHGWSDSSAFWFAVRSARGAVLSLMDTMLEEFEFDHPDRIRAHVRDTLCASSEYDEYRPPIHLYDVTVSVLEGLASEDLDVLWASLWTSSGAKDTDVHLLGAVNWEERGLIQGHTIKYGESMDEWVQQGHRLGYDHVSMEEFASGAAGERGEFIGPDQCPHPLASEVRGFQTTYCDLMFYVLRAVEGVIQLHGASDVMNCGVDIDALYGSLMAILVCVPDLVCTSRVAPSGTDGHMAFIREQIRRAWFMMREMAMGNSPCTDNPDQVEAYRRRYTAGDGEVARVFDMLVDLSVSLGEVLSYLDRVADQDDPLVTDDGTPTGRAISGLIVLYNVLDRDDTSSNAPDGIETCSLTAAAAAVFQVFSLMLCPEYATYDDKYARHSVKVRLQAVYDELSKVSIPVLRLQWISHVMSVIVENLPGVMDRDPEEDDDDTAGSVGEGEQSGPQYRRSIRIDAGGVLVTIHQGSGSVVGTGCVVSGCAHTFVSYLLGENVHGNVLELGSGTGVVAVSIAANGCKVVATDVETNPDRPPVRRGKEESIEDACASGRFVNTLDVIRYNVEENKDFIKNMDGSVDVMRMEWGEEEDIQGLVDVHTEAFDFVIGCNVTYNRDSWVDLFHTIEAVMIPTTRVFLAIPITSDYLVEFKKEARRHMFDVTMVFADGDTEVAVFELDTYYGEGDDEICWGTSNYDPEMVPEGEPFAQRHTYPHRDFIDKLRHLELRIEEFKKNNPSSRCVSQSRCLDYCRFCDWKGGTKTHYRDPWTGEHWDGVFLHAMEAHNVHPLKCTIENVEYSLSQKDWSNPIRR